MLPEAELVVRTIESSESAYAPYSKFKVGAVLRSSKDGSYFNGCNVENASFGLTICAERTAVVKAVSQGHTSFDQVYVYAETEDFCWPCGACRQVLNEFGPEMEVISINKHRQTCKVLLSELLPKSFGPQTLHSAHQ